MRAYKRLMRPTVGRTAALGEMLRDHCSPCNGALQESRDAYRHASKTSIKYKQQSAQLRRLRGVLVVDGSRRWAAVPGLAVAPAPVRHSSSRSRAAREISGSVSSVWPRAVRWEIAASRRVRAGAGRSR